MGISRHLADSHVCHYVFANIINDGSCWAYDIVFFNLSVRENVISNVVISVLLAKHALRYLFVFDITMSFVIFLRMPYHLTLKVTS